MSRYRLTARRRNTWREHGLIFIEVVRHESPGCTVSEGLVRGSPTDTAYLLVERDGNVDTFLLLRPDEMAAIGWLATGVLWSHHMGPKESE